MRSEELRTQALQAVARPRDVFRSAIAEAVDDVCALLARLRSEGSGARERHARELGAFAAGRVDVERFAATFGYSASVNVDSLAVIDAARAVLEQIAGSGDDAFCVRLERGGDLRETVRTALGSLGRAFGAARTVQLARSGRYTAAEHASLVQAFPPDRWNRAERQMAPPLVIQLSGEDLRAGELATFLDGTQKVVLVVDSPAPPAPLVRLITPGILVAQIGDPAKLTGLLGGDTPAIVAIVAENAARFSHDPAGGARLEQRLAIEHVPADAPRGRIGGLSAFQQREELHQLEALAAASIAVRSAAVQVDVVSAGNDVDPADRLAAWLLAQAGAMEL